jgi:predicted nucleic acid-binding protein
VTDRGVHTPGGGCSAPALSLLSRVYELRANVSAYHAVYVAVAGHLAYPLLTADP